MDNPVRTAEHRWRMGQRLAQLRESLGTILPAAGSLVWEIGCGHGHFLAALAAARPSGLFVGIDVARERIARAQRKRDRARLANLHFLQAEAHDFIDVLPEPITLAAIYVLFPDPWPKRRHHKHRIMRPAFLHAIAQRAEEGARLYFRTDFAPYFQETRTLLADHPDWETVEEPWPFEHPTVFQGRAAAHFSLVARRRPGMRGHKLPAAKTCAG